MGGISFLYGPPPTPSETTFPSGRAVGLLQGPPRPASGGRRPAKAKEEGVKMYVTWGGDVWRRTLNVLLHGGGGREVPRLQTGVDGSSSVVSPWHSGRWRCGWLSPGPQPSKVGSSWPLGSLRRSGCSCRPHGSTSPPYNNVPHLGRIVFNVKKQRLGRSPFSDIAPWNLQHGG